MSNIDYTAEIDPRYVEPIVTTSTDGDKRFLTEEEFRAGKPGYVWMDETGKLTFGPNSQPGEKIEKADLPETEGR